MAVVNGKRIALDGGHTGYVDAEEYLIGMVDRQVPPGYGVETLKAQTAVARTHIYKKMRDSDRIKGSELEIIYIEESGLEGPWDSGKFVEYYEIIDNTVKTTAGVVMTYGDKEINTLYYRASAEMTRAGGRHHPYLEPVENRRDVETENYLSVVDWPAKTFVSKLKELGRDTELAISQMSESIQVTEKDGAGYVGKIRIENHIYTGKEVLEALSLALSCFTLKDYEGQIRVACKGVNHGYGLSQRGARMMGGEGYS